MHWGRYQPEPLPDWPTKALRNAQCYREEADRLEAAALAALGVGPRPEQPPPRSVNSDGFSCESWTDGAIVYLRIADEEASIELPLVSIDDATQLIEEVVDAFGIAAWASARFGDDEPTPDVEVPHEDALDLAATKLYVFTEDACECLPCGDLRTVAAFLSALADRQRARERSEGGGGE